MQDKVNILIVDDEIEVLNALTRIFRRKYQVHTSDDPVAAIDLLKQHDFAVIISDMKMPVMTGDKFLEQAFLICPDTPRLLLTGYADMQSTADAINIGKINNYITKPWDNEELMELVDQSAEQYETHMAAKCYLQHIEGKNAKLTAHSKALNKKLIQDQAQLQTLSETIKSKNDNARNLFHDMINLISKVSQTAVDDDCDHIKRVAIHCQHLAKRLKLKSPIVTRCYLAGLMHEIGKVSLPDELIQAVEAELNNENWELKAKQSETAAELIATIPVLEPIARIVKCQYEKLDGTGLPNHLTDVDIPIESRILSIVNTYDKLLIGRTTGHTLSPEIAQEQMKKNKGAFDPIIMKEYFDMLNRHKFNVTDNIDICIGTSQLESGMTLSRDLVGKDKVTLLTKGTELTRNNIKRLVEHERQWQIFLNVFVH